MMSEDMLNSSYARERNMLKSLLREPRVAQRGDKVSFEQDIEGNLVFSNEPTVPAVLNHGARVRFASPVILVGGSDLREVPDVAIYEHGRFIFDGRAIVQTANLRGGNWFEVL
jgi:hypothetical protein